MITRVGIIGAGFIGARHIQSLATFEDVKLVSVADVDQDRAGLAASKVGAAIYTDYDIMLDREDLDAVYICTPPFTHGRPEHSCIEAGLPIFVEKPLATDLQTAEKIAQRVSETNLITGVGYHWRYVDFMDDVTDLLRSRPARLVIGYWLDSTPPPPWWEKEAYSGGQVVEQTTHIFDLARLLVGEVDMIYAAANRTPRSNHLASDISEVSTATLRFTTGAIGCISSTCLLESPYRIGLDLICDGLAIEVRSNELIINSGEDRQTRRAEGNPIIREDRDFIDAVQGKPHRIRAPYAEALRTHRLTTTALRAAREARAIELSPTTAVLGND